jgi:hypothetical protein
LVRRADWELLRTPDRSANPLASAKPVAGYLRWAAVAAPVITFCYASPNNNRADWDISLLVLTVILAALYVGLFFAMVKASDRESRQRNLLAQIVRATVNPDWLKRSDCEQVMATLHPVLESLALPVDARHWSLRNPDPELAPFVYTMARYMMPIEPENDWDTVALRIWSLMEANSRTAEISPILSR